MSILVGRIPIEKISEALQLIPKKTRAPRRVHVLRQYRKALKHSRDMTCSREQWDTIALPNIRKAYRDLMHETNEVIINTAVQKGDKWLKQIEPGIPYIIPYGPGGSLYQRNEPCAEMYLDEDRFLDMEEEDRYAFESENNKHTDWKVESW
eukprot:TRINITY_DN1307_c0_g1_i1.p1 TRINITY_DN1307_c0_g1~~TRINITY_DN1307_c0_g1_i1.p1  ORF type:complete len:151 (+),score=30.66 TRINITY_DN1307_c0_g1_i1:31-483(+)